MNSWPVHVWRRDPLDGEKEEYPWDQKPLDETEKKPVLNITKDSYTNLRHEQKGRARFSVRRSPDTPPVSSAQVGSPIEGMCVRDPNSFSSEHWKCRKRGEEEYDTLIERAAADLRGHCCCWAEGPWWWGAGHSAQILSWGWDSPAGLLLSWPSLAPAPWHHYAALTPLLVCKPAATESGEESMRGPTAGGLAGWVLPSPLPFSPRIAPHESVPICVALPKWWRAGSHPVTLGHPPNSPKPTLLLSTASQTDRPDFDGCLRRSLSFCLGLVLPTAQQVSNRDPGCSCSITNKPTSKGIKSRRSVIWTYWIHRQNQLVLVSLQLKLCG